MDAVRGSSPVLFRTGITSRVLSRGTGLVWKGNDVESRGHLKTFRFSDHLRGANERAKFSLIAAFFLYRVVKNQARTMASSSSSAAALSQRAISPQFRRGLLASSTRARSTMMESQRRAFSKEKESVKRDMLEHKKSTPIASASASTATGTGGPTAPTPAATGTAEDDLDFIRGHLWFANVYPERRHFLDFRHRFATRNHEALIERIIPDGVKITQCVSRPKEGSRGLCSLGENGAWIIREPPRGEPRGSGFDCVEEQIPVKFDCVEEQNLRFPVKFDCVEEQTETVRWCETARVTVRLPQVEGFLGGVFVDLKPIRRWCFCGLESHQSQVVFSWTSRPIPDCAGPS